MSLSLSESGRPYFTNNYAPLSKYNPSLGVPIVSPFVVGEQILPHFKGFDYVNPNYDTLTNPSSYSTYPTISQGYMEFCPKGDCVQYKGARVPCNTSRSK